jgi:hypothetical protein
MSLKQLLIVVSAATLILWLSWLFIIFEVDPTSAGIFGLLFFYASLFCALLGTLFVFFTLAKRRLNKDELEQKVVTGSFRQSIFFALTLTLVLFLQSKHFLTWWNLIILVVATTLLEYLFLSFKKKEPTKPDNSASQPYIPPDF